MRIRKVSRTSGLMALTAILMSVLALSVEMTTHICRIEFFDPLPDLTSTLAYGLIVLTLGIALASIRFGDLSEPNADGAPSKLLDALDLRRATGRLLWLRILIPPAFAVALLYTVLFLPLTLLGLMTFIFGFGVCAFSPLANLVAIGGYLLHIRDNKPAWKRLAPPPRIERLANFISAALVIQVMASLAGQPAAVGWLLSQADARDSARGWLFEPLQQLQAPSVLARAAMRGGSNHPIVGWFWRPAAGGVSPVSIFPARSGDPDTDARGDASVRRRYFELTGGRPPTQASGEWWDVMDGRQELIGGDRVASREHGLTLAKSDLVGALRPASETAYQEWTLVFRNATARATEARFHALLPEGGFISKASLWLNGQESPAAFGGKGKTREAYSEIVRSSVSLQYPRDPLLITASTPERVLVQCFPVPAGGEIKIRLGCTSPLRWGGGGRPTLSLAAPLVVDRNFEWSPQLISTYRYVGSWPESLKLDPRDGWRLTRDDPTPDGTVRHILSAETPPSDGQTTRWVRWSAERPPGTKSPVPGGRRLWDPTQTVSRAGIDFLVVLDTSESLRPALTEDDARRLGAALAAYPDSRVRCLLQRDWNGSDSPGPSWSEPWVSTVNAQDVLVRAFQHRDRGGLNPIGPLTRALDLASENPRPTAILWLHGAHPEGIFDTAGLESALRLAPRRVTLTALACVTGPNDVIGSLSSTGRARSLQRGMFPDPFGELVLVAASQPDAGQTRPVPAELTPLGGSEPAISGLYLPNSIDRKKNDWGRLTAGSRIVSAWRHGVTEEFSDSKQWIRLGVEQRVVTPLTGAVVLESKKDYDQYSLSNSVASTDLPSVPEPGTLGLLALAGGAHWVARRRIARKKRAVAE